MKITPQRMMVWITALSLSSAGATASAEGLSSWFKRGETKQMTPSGTKVDTLGNTVESPWSKVKSSVGGMGSSVKQKFSRNEKSNSDAKKNSEDPVSLAREAHPSVDFYLSVARMQEQTNNVPGAIEQCKRALEVDSKNLGALLALARLYDRQDQMTEATNYYLRAVKFHPQEASVHNDLGLCYARQHKYEEATASLRKAIEQQPDRVLYRNNLATILVEQGKVDDALETLSAVHGKTVAHYNIGFLLNKRGQTDAALQQFRLAAAADPSFEAAQQWVATLSGNQSVKPAPSATPAVTAPVAQVATKPAEPAPAAKPEPRREPAPRIQEVAHTAPSTSAGLDNDNDGALTTHGTRGPVLQMAGPGATADSSPATVAVNSRTVPTVAKRETRLPPTPDQIGDYSRDPLLSGSSVEPLPPVDAQHYPPSRY